MLQLRAIAAAIDRVVHPCAAALGRPGIEVQIELAHHRAFAIENVEKPHARMPDRRARRAYRDAEDRFDHAKHAGEHAVLRKVGLYLLVGEAVALLPQLVRGIGYVPRRKLGQAEPVAREWP